MRAYAQWPDYRLFAYEQRLSELELRALGATELDATSDGVSFEHETPQDLPGRLTYFVAVVEADGTRTLCAQREEELAHLAGRGRVQRQATRFGVHGFHEYKGKFNPQLARALINAIEPDAEVIIDPFVGSGTTLVEALRLQRDARGRDRSPIAAFMASVKTESLLAPDPEALAAQLLAVSDAVGAALKLGQDYGRSKAVSWLTPKAHDFLGDWFTAPALAGLTQGLDAHADRDSLACRLSLLALSSILRDVSLQEPQDLRVRRRPEGFIAPSLRDAYLEKVDRLVEALSELEPGTGTSACDVRLGNAHDDDLFDQADGRRLILTSPPYATALPYIDTDRLSIVALGLVTPQKLRTLEAGLTGSREWSTPERQRWWQALRENSEGLPTHVTTLLRKITLANEAAQAGFRRAAVPPLLYRYFAQMRGSLTSWARHLRSGEKAVVVVGRNRTGPAGAQVAIDTPTLLGWCAEQVGFEVADQHVLETWPRFGLHAANAVQGEDALVLRRR